METQTGTPAAAGTSLKSINLSKGEKIDLTKDNPELKTVGVGVSWEERIGIGDGFDVDASTIVQTNGMFSGNMEDLLFYKSPLTNNPANKKERSILDGALIHSGDERTGATEGDDETMIYHLDKLPKDRDCLIVVVNVFDAAQNKQNFGMIKQAQVRIYNQVSGAEIAKQDLSEDYSKYNAIVLGRFYVHNGEWKYEAINEPMNGNIVEITEKY